MQRLLPKAALRRSICFSCYYRQTNKLNNKRAFHSSRPTHVPLVPFPAFLLGAFKTGKLVSVISLSSKTSLTLLPHTFRRGKGSKLQLVAKILAGIPLFGVGLLFAVGLDQAPNTSRLRLIYLSEEEEEDIVKDEINTLLDAQRGLVAPRDSEAVIWLQTIVDNLAAVAVDDIRDPVRQYSIQKKETVNDSDSTEVLVVPSNDIETIVSSTADEIRANIPKRNFEVDFICDSTTVNAMCVGSHIVVYDLLTQYMEYDSSKMAVILSHEIAHSIQRHFVEQHGFAALMFMLGDITRGVFWMVTESLGPYVNQKINDYISMFITLETQTTYNRRLEKEADLVGLMILAKAGYDPRVAIEVWERMAELENYIDDKAEQVVAGSQNKAIDTVEELQQVNIVEFFSTLISNWFGSSHPPSEERIEYMKEHLDEAIKVYEQSIQLNGYPKEYIFQMDDVGNNNSLFTNVKNWLSSIIITVK